MRCDAVNGRMCLADDIWPLADRPMWVSRDAKTTAADHLSLSCYCPAREHDGRKLQISVGEFKPVIWNCHAGCGELDVRHALVRGRRMRPACLPISAEKLNDLLERLTAIAEDGSMRHADKVLHFAEMLTSGKGQLPRGTELDALAARCQVSRSEAYKALGGNPRRPK
jgi:hypothetical protein